MSFIFVSLLTPVITLPSALVAGSFTGLGSFGSIAAVNCVARSLMKSASMFLECGSMLLCAVMLRDLCTVVVLWLLLGSMR